MTQLYIYYVYCFIFFTYINESNVNNGARPDSARHCPPVLSTQAPFPHRCSKVFVVEQNHGIQPDKPVLRNGTSVPYRLDLFTVFSLMRWSVDVV